MLSTPRQRLLRGVKPTYTPTRTITTTTTSTSQQTSSPSQTQTHTPRGLRKEGDISSVFASLSGSPSTPLPPRFSSLKTSLVRGHEAGLLASWTRLLSSLRDEVNCISTHGSDLIPTIPFSSLTSPSLVQSFSASLLKRGVAIIRGVVPPSEALSWKEEIKDYIRANPSTKGFPKDNPAVYELYWSPGQVKARAHPNMLATQSFLMSLWNTSPTSSSSLSSTAEQISTTTPLTYADRVRIRQPGISGFVLGPHVDGGSVERWEEEGYGKGNVYDKIFEGKWEDFDPWDARGRESVESDLYSGAGACSMFRMFQGWLSLSSTDPGEGTLRVNPLFKLAISYFLLRPFFRPKDSNRHSLGFLDAENWEIEPSQSSILHGATLGCTQELTDALHPHLELEKSMISIPHVEPGDYVAWHCDAIHAVEREHQGKGDSSVLYIPVCPDTENNREYLGRQRSAFEEGTPGPDFPGGEGERGFKGRMGRRDVEAAGGREGLKGMGFL